MDVQGLLIERRITASLLIFSGIVFLVAASLFTARVIWKWPAGQSETYLRWERGVVIAGFLVNVLGFVLLEDKLRTAGDTMIARMALVIYIIAAALMAVAETNYLSNRQWVYPQIIAHVVLAFLAQAAFGVGILRTELLPNWVGWVTILWNLGCLVVVPIFYPNDIYFPWLHYVAPLIIGIALLMKA